MTWLSDVLITHPEIAVFLTVGLGFLVGRLHYRAIALGAVTGTLLVGVAVGAVVTAPDAQGVAAHLAVGGPAKAIFFLFFLFALGFRLGPQFVAGLRGSGLPQAVFAVVLAVVGFTTVVALSVVLGYNPGVAAGLAGGGLTQSAVIGVAQSSIEGLAVSPATVKEWSDLVPVAYAVTYLFGTVGTALFCANVAPRMLGVADLPAAAAALGRKIGLTEHSPDVAPAFLEVSRRSYRLGSLPAGVTVAQELEAHLQVAAGGDHHVFVARVRHGDGPASDAGVATPLAAGDRIALTARRMDLFAPYLAGLADEIDDASLLDFPVEDLWVVVTRKEIVGATVGALRHDPEARRVYVRGLRRGGHELPFGDATVVHAGDELHLQGPLPLLEHWIAHIGFPERSAPDAGMITLGLGTAAGALIGVPTVLAGTIPIGLSTSVGALLAGLVVGWLRAKRPVFGRIPAATDWFLETAGLTFFIAIVGIGAGPGFVTGLTRYGVSLLLAGAVVTLLPLVVMTVLSRFVFRFDPVITLGVLAGSRSASAAAGACREAARSSVPMLGYTIPYAVANVALTIGGAVVVAVLA